MNVRAKVAEHLAVGLVDEQFYLLLQVRLLVAGSFDEPLDLGLGELEGDDIAHVHIALFRWRVWRGA